MQKALISKEEADEITEKQKAVQRNEANEIRLNMETEAGVRAALQF